MVYIFLINEQNQCKKDFSDFAGGNPFAKSVKNSSAMGLDDDITGQSLQGKIPNPLSSSEVGPSKLEYPIDVSGNPAYAATIKFQVMQREGLVYYYEKFFENNQHS